jgi:hypothetical protein
MLFAGCVTNFFKLLLLFKNGKIYKYKISTNGEMKHMMSVGLT